MNMLQTGWLAGVTHTNEPRLFAAVDMGDPKWRDVLAPRPDFRGALYQFLIGLLQVGFAPPTRQDWRDRRKNPPTAAELEAAFADIAGAFLLENPDGPAFLQDLELEDAKPASIRDLLLEQGSVSGQHFNKPSDDFGVCESCAAQALLTLQLNAPPGGRGTRTSVRGGGPLTTLLMPNDHNATLWERIWLNVIPHDELDYPPVKQWSDILPWMGPTRRSDDPGGIVTTPESVHPLQAYWSMPRRIRFDWSDAAAGVCSICGTQSPRLVRRYFTRHGGTNYEGAWRHPLSAYRFDPKGQKPPLAIKGPQGGIGYRYWLGLTQGSEDENIAAAKVVSASVKGVGKGYTLRLWAFGAATDNMKELCWYDSVMPIYAVAQEHREQFGREVKNLLDVATLSADILHRQVKAAWFRRPADQKNTSVVRQSFWDGSEKLFYEMVRQLANADLSDGKAVAPVYHQWLVSSRNLMISLFEEWALRGPLEDLDMKRMVAAWGQLGRDLNRNKLIKQLWKSIHGHSEAAA